MCPNREKKKFINKTTTIIKNKNKNKPMKKETSLEIKQNIKTFNKKQLDIMRFVPKQYKSGYDPKSQFKLVLEQFKRGGTKYPEPANGMRRYKICNVHQCQYIETKTSNTYNKHWHRYHQTESRNRTNSLIVDLDDNQFLQRMEKWKESIEQ